MRILGNSLVTLLNGFSIQQKLWGGFFIVLCVLVVVVANTLINLADTQKQVDVMTKDIQPTLLASSALKSTLKEATTALGFYLLTKEEIHKNAYKQFLLRIDVAVQELKATPIASKDQVTQQTVKSIEAEVAKFKAYETRMINLAETLTDNFHALGYAGGNLNPISREMLQSISNMILSEEQEEANNERRALLMRITELRYNLTSAINNLRIYLFYGNDDALSNVTLFFGGVADGIEKVAEFSDMLTFEQEEGLNNLRAAVEKWKGHLQKIIDIQKGDKARMDAYLIKAEITPILQSVDTHLNNLVQEQRDAIESTGNELIVQAAQTTKVVGLLLLVGLGIGAIVAWLITRVIVSPLRDAVNAMGDIAHGEGDLTRRLQVNGRDETAQIAAGFNLFAEKILDLVRQVSESVSHVAVTSEELTHATKFSQSIVGKQKHETDQIASAVGQMRTAAQEVAKNAELTAEAARNADRDTQDGRNIVNNALGSINELAAETQVSADVIEKLGNDIKGINEVIDLIIGVTDQTNLLALNAAIEAARAGEQGRGFAVVADEVRSLADRTKQSTHEIKNKIENLQREAHNAVTRMVVNRDKAQDTADMAKQAGESLDLITQSVSNITNMSNQIAAASEEQSAVAVEINNFIDNVSRLADEAFDATRQVANSTSALDQLSEMLNRHVGRFKIH